MSTKAQWKVKWQKPWMPSFQIEICKATEKRYSGSIQFKKWRNMIILFYSKISSVKIKICSNTPNIFWIYLKIKFSSVMPVCVMHLLFQKHIKPVTGRWRVSACGSFSRILHKLIIMPYFMSIKQLYIVFAKNKRTSSITFTIWRNVKLTFVINWYQCMKKVK